MPTAPASWPQLLEPGLREIFTARSFGRPSPALMRLFGMRDSNKLRETYLGGGAFPPAPRFEGSVQYADLGTGWKTNIVNHELALGFAVQRSWVDDEQYGMINEMAGDLGDSFAVARELDAADVFNQAFSSTTYRLGDSNLGGDGVVLCSAAHPNSPKNPGTTQSNTAALALTVDNFDLVRQRMTNFTDDRGTKVGIVPDTVLISRALERTAFQIFSPGARLEPGTAEFNSNLFAGVNVRDRLAADATPPRVAEPHRARVRAGGRLRRHPGEVPRLRALRPRLQGLEVRLRVQPVVMPALLR
jgi:hypothetical protein